MIILIPLNGVIAAKQGQFQAQQMKLKDKRGKIINEIVQGIKIIKLYGWEPSFQDQVEEIRKQEIALLKKFSHWSVGTYFIMTCTPILVSLITFATYVLSDENNVLDAQKAFVAIALFNILQFPLTMFPMLIAFLVQARVAIQRIDKYMNLDEPGKMDALKQVPVADPDNAIEISKASFKWTNEEEEPYLKEIDLKVKEKSLVAVVGTVGSGKSSLLSAILGEMQHVDGTVAIKGSLGYAAQQAWIQNNTLKDNVLFNQKLDEEWYNEVIEACALKPDLKTLPAGDSTEIGEKGINLSGGQKHRVALARIVYSKVDVCFLDDPLSAVDAHVGKHIFEQVISNTGLLKDKTRVFVTNAVSLLPQVDEILVIKDGSIAERGTYQELQDAKGPFADYLKEHMNEQEEDVSKAEDQEATDEKDDGDKVAQKRRPSTAKKEDPKQYEKERVETGKVNLSVYTFYIRNMGMLMFGSSIIFFILYEVLNTSSKVWLSLWTDEENLRSIANTTGNATIDSTYSSHDRLFNLGILAAYGIGAGIAQVISALLLNLASLNGGKKLHNKMLKNILRSPMSFFDTTPQGRIMNRFGKDVDALDTNMQFVLRSAIACVFSVIATFGVISYTTPVFMVPVVIILGGYYFVQQVYVAISRQLKRLESVAKSPIYSHFGETLNGTSTIKAFQLQDDFIKQNETLVDRNQKANYPSIVANRWLAVRLEMVGNTIVFCSALFAVLSKDTLSPGLVGLSVTYAMTVTQTLNWLVRTMTEVETNVVAAERLKEYSQIKQEAKWTLDSDDKHESWPSKAEIEFKNVKAKYREGLPAVLNDLSFIIEAQNRVGIVGRTGAGKSTITLVLFRIMEIEEGEILIDGVDIATVGLHCLRNKLTIIPQDPVLFSGTLRLNLDPFNKYSDDELWQTLKLAHLDNFVTNLKEGLQHEITEGGENLSVGQRQLICLAR